MLCINELNLLPRASCGIRFCAVWMDEVLRRLVGYGSAYRLDEAISTGWMKFYRRRLHPTLHWLDEVVCRLDEAKSRLDEGERRQ